MRFFERYQGWLHALGWATFISLPFLTLPDMVWNQPYFLSLGVAQLLTSGLIIPFFYINLRSLTPTLLRDHTTQRFLLVILGMLVSVTLVKLGSYYVFPPMPRLGLPPGPPPVPGTMFPGRPPGPEHYPGPGPLGSPGPWPGMLATAISLGFALMVSSLMALFRYHTRSQEAQQQMVLEKVSAELAMLKLQVSPHFLFNTLNNIRWLARKKSDQTEAAVVTLAQLLRYMIYQAQQDTVSLRQEVQHLQHYIDLQKMRLTDNTTVTFSCEGDIDAYQIEPLLFIPFVENAFKYGVHPRQAGPIRISLTVVDDTLVFCTENPTAEPPANRLAGTLRTDAEQRDDASGIGINNVRRRLLLHYPALHTLQLTREQGIFRVVLTLHLHHEQVALPRH